jgi:hypothetical protein
MLALKWWGIRTGWERPRTTDLNPLELTTHRLDGHRLNRVLSDDSVCADLTTTHSEV